MPFRLASRESAYTHMRDAHAGDAFLSLSLSLSPPSVAPSIDEQQKNGRERACVPNRHPFPTKSFPGKGVRHAAPVGARRAGKRDKREKGTGRMYERLRERGKREKKDDTGSCMPRTASHTWPACPVSSEGEREQNALALSVTSHLFVHRFAWCSKKEAPDGYLVTAAASTLRCTAPRPPRLAPALHASATMCEKSRVAGREGWR